jgi:hypothetical protein
MNRYVERFLAAIRMDADLVWEKRGGDRPWPKLEPRYRKIVQLMAEKYERQEEFYLSMSDDLLTESLYFWQHNEEVRSTVVYDFVSSLYDDFVKGYEDYVRRKEVLRLMLLRFNGLGGVLRHVYSYIPTDP